MGFRRTMITESPRRNILLINLSLLTATAFFFPFPVLGTWRINKKLWLSGAFCTSFKSKTHCPGNLKNNKNNLVTGGFWSKTHLAKDKNPRHNTHCPKKLIKIVENKQTSVHISLTFSRTILQWRSNALTRPRSFLLFLQLMSTYNHKKHL